MCVFTPSMFGQIDLSPKIQKDKETTSESGGTVSL